MKTDEKTRAVETEIELEASPEDVWQALTNPEVLTRWFPMEARATPGLGGSITLKWGSSIECRCDIEVWEPGRHLRTTWAEPSSDEGPARPLLVDYRLESRGGRTVLRLVHSGFQEGWDDEYDGVRRGWTYELRSLRHYFGHKEGRVRRVAWARTPIDVPYREAWNRLWSDHGLLREGRRPGDQEGSPYAFTMATGDKLEGKVLVNEAPTDFSGTVTSHENSLFRLAIEKCSGRPEAWLWLSSWDLPQSRVDDFQQRWTAMLDELFA